MHTIIGSGGAIGKVLAEELPYLGKKVRLVSRSPKAVNASDELVPADVTNKDQLERAIAGSSVVYICVGFPYATGYWEEHWPNFVQHAIDSCEKHAARLVFFDNVYMYAPEEMPHMTENSRVAPASRKGKVRQKVADAIMNAHAEGRIQACIGRSADFYGPGIQNSVLIETVVKPLLQGKKANWLGDPRFLHSFTYTPDAAKAMAILGTSEKSWGQIWHLPTARPAISGHEWIRLIAEGLGKQANYRKVGMFMVKLLGLFDTTMKELPEMMYQNDRDYFFDSSKFEATFGLKPTPYKDGIAEMLNAMR